MSDDQQPAGNALADMINRGQIASGAGGGDTGGGGGALDAPGSIIDAILRKFGLNGHSTGGLAALFGDLPNIFGGFSIQNVFSGTNARGGVLASFFANLGFEFGGSIHGDVTAGVQAAPVDTSGSANSDGGDAQTATLNTIPTAAIHDTGIQNIQAQHITDASPTPKASAVRAARSESSGMSI